MDPATVYRGTSIGRPLDPSYPTNKAVMLLMPAAGIVAALVGVLRGAGMLDAGAAGLVAGGVVFGSWALGRELAPDQNAAAFAGMALAFVLLFFVESPSLLWLFLPLFLARIVNRTVGLPARVSDSIAVTLLVAWAVYSLSNPLLGLVAAAAFGFDAVLVKPQRHQIGFAVVCLAVTGGWVWRYGFSFGDLTSLTSMPGSIAAIIAVASLIGMLWMRQTQSAGDATGELLPHRRVQAGILIGLLVALTSFASGGAGVESAGLLWATLAGALLGRWA